MKVKLCEREVRYIDTFKKMENTSFLYFALAVPNTVRWKSMKLFMKTAKNLEFKKLSLVFYIPCFLFHIQFVNN